MNVIIKLQSFSALIHFNRANVCPVIRATRKCTLVIWEIMQEKMNWKIRSAIMAHWEVFGSHEIHQVLHLSNLSQPVTPKTLFVVWMDDWFAVVELVLKYPVVNRDVVIVAQKAAGHIIKVSCILCSFSFIFMLIALFFAVYDMLSYMGHLWTLSFSTTKCAVDWRVKENTHVFCIFFPFCFFYFFFILKTDDRCYECGDRGHYARDCRRHGRSRKR